MTETFEDKVERIARMWFEDTGPHHDFVALSWEKGHPDDKDFARYTARFILTKLAMIESGIE